MSQNSCCVPGCSVTIKDGIPLHRFPNPNVNAEKFNSWVSKIGGTVATMDNLDVYSNRRVCHKHFEEIHKYPRNRLCKLAVPVLYLPEQLDTESVTLPDLPSTSGYQRIPYEIPMREQLHTESATLPDLASTSGYQRIPCEIPLRVELFTKPDTMPALFRSMSDIQKTSSEGQMTGHEQHIMQKEQNKNYIYKSTKPKGVFVPVTKHREYKKLLKQLKKSESAKVTFKQKYNLAKKMTRTTAFSIMTSKMSATAKIFCQMQVSQGGKKKPGRRFTLDQKILALSLYKPSPKAYRLLSQMCILPSRRTLQNLLHKLDLKVGINEIMFENLKSRVAKLPEHHKYCAILFDEMAIQPSITYDKRHDKIIGFVDNGEKTEKEFCDHVLVFMIRGVVKKFKQPIAYFYCHGSTKTHELKAQIKNIILKVQETGLKVIATICDQGTSNVAAINLLLKETREFFIRKGKAYREGYYKIGKDKIVPLYDPPHLIKGIRNNLLNKNLKYIMNGKECTAKWSHIVALYNRCPSYKGVKLVHKLTALHVFPSLIPKMRVKHCTQVFSQSVAVGLGCLADMGVLDKASHETAELLIFFDNLFDSVNGSFSDIRHGKMYRAAVTPTSAHQNLWNYSIPILKTMRFVNGKSQGVVPSLSSWIKTLQGFKNIVFFLHSKGINSLLLRNFNQDPLENFFGAIRAHGHSNIMPTASAFEGAFKTLLINNVTSSHSVGANCEKDDSVCLKSLKSLLVNLGDSKTTTECENEIDCAHICMKLLNAEALLRSKTPVDMEKCAAIGYCSGWMAQLAKRNVYKNCATCRHDLEEENILDFHKYIKMKEYGNKKWLCYPTRALFDFFVQVEHICTEILKENCNKTNLGGYIKLIITINLNLNFISCARHKNEFTNFLINKSKNFFINNWCKEINGVITGKITFWDKNDPMKEKAYIHYSRNKGRKRINQTNKSVNV